MTIEQGEPLALPMSSIRQRRNLKFNPELRLTPLTPVARKAKQLKVVEDGLAERYQIEEFLGRGSSSVVHKATRKLDGEIVVVKKMNVSDSGLVQLARREFEILKDIHHPNIVKATEFYDVGLSTAMVMEYFSGCTMFSAVHSSSSGAILESQAHCLFTGLVRAVEHLHNLDIVHRDIKPDNVLVKEDLTDLKLLDFNTARRIEDGGALSMTGTMLYAAPEVLQDYASPGKAADVWGLGTCLYFMLSGALPQSRQKTQNLVAASRRPLKLWTDRWLHISEPCKDVIRQALALDEELRATASELLETQWVLTPPVDDVVDVKPSLRLEAAPKPFFSTNSDSGSSTCYSETVSESSSEPCGDLTPHPKN